MDWANEWQKNVPMSGLDWTVYLANKVNERIEQDRQAFKQELVQEIEAELKQAYERENLAKKPTYDTFQVGLARGEQSAYESMLNLINQKK